MSSVSVERTAIKSALSKAGLSKIDNDILSKCVGLAQQFDLTPEQMAESWDAFSLNKGVTELTDHTYQSYRNQLIKDAEGSRPNTSSVGAVTVRGGNSNKRQAQDGLNMVTPPTKRANQAGGAPSSVDSVASSSVISPKRSPSTPAVNLPKYSERTGVDKVVASYNPNKLDPASDDAAERQLCAISTSDFGDSNVKQSYRHMFTTLEERSQILDDQLVRMGNHIIEKYGIGEGENGIAPLEAVNVARQDMVCCVGRVCNEAHEGKLNKTSVVLEGARNTCGGARINVDLSHLQSTKTPYSLFPGQIVAMEGLNVTGRKFVAHRICEGAPHKPATTSIRELRQHVDRQGGKPLKMLSVCGPFTTSDNLSYEPLMDLLNVILEKSPDVVILAGPFVDLRQQLVKSGNTKVELEGEDEMLTSYEAFFASKIAALIEECFLTKEELTTQFVLMPSVDDATAAWVYPQPPFEDTVANGGKIIKNIPGGEGFQAGTLGLRSIQAGGKSRIHCVPNPCTLKINEVVVGVTSTDALFHISSEETNANLEPGSRLRRISQHLLQQRSFYPLFPPPANMPANLDLKQMKHWEMPCRPDILIIPSKLTAFASPVLDSTLVVNPGHLSKGTTGGTYATLELHPMSREALDNAGGDDVELPHSVVDRIRVEVKRI